MMLLEVFASDRLKLCPKTSLTSRVERTADHAVVQEAVQRRQEALPRGKAMVQPRQRRRVPPPSGRRLKLHHLPPVHRQRLCTTTSTTPWHPGLNAT